VWQSGSADAKTLRDSSTGADAFATAQSEHASVAVTAGLMELMTDDELEGVIAHELSHVRNYDILITSIAPRSRVRSRDCLHGTLGHDFWRFWRLPRRQSGWRRLAALIMLIVAPIAAMLIQLGFRDSVSLPPTPPARAMVGHPYGLISALEKLGAYNKRIPMDVPPATASLFIVAPLSAGQVLSGMFSTHPPLSERIAVLRNMTVSR